MTDPIPSSTPKILLVQRVKEVHHIQFLHERILDERVASGFAQEIAQIIDQTPDPKILLDFGKVQYLSSIVLGKLAQLHKKAAAAGGRLVLCSLRAEILEIFQITKLDKVLAIVPDVKAGYAKLK
jgi:anti-sigma B factor antagonist